MKSFIISRLSQLDVKWANVHIGNADWLEVLHSNPNYQLIMVNEGPVYLQVEGENHILKTGETFILKPWEQHKGWKALGDNAGFFWVQFTANPVLEMVNNWSDLTPKDKIFHHDHSILRTNNEVNNTDSLLIPHRFTPTRRYVLLRIFEELITIFNRPEGYYRFRLTLQLGTFLEELAHDLLEQRHLKEPRSTSFLVYRRLVNLLDEYYYMDLSVAEIEGNTQRKYEYLCQVFRRYSGITIGSYTRQLRTQRAKYLLESTDKKINEISRNVGFQDPYYFSKLFKETVGFTPTEYRRRALKLTL